jgi:hypothetical protein
MENHQMKPYCYQINDWNDTTVFPTLDKAVAWLKKHGYRASLCKTDTPVYAYTEDCEEGKPADLSDYIEAVKLNLDTIRVEAQRLWDKSKQEEDEIRKRIEAGGKVVMITGCLPLCACSVDDIVKQIVLRDGFRWRD